MVTMAINGKPPHFVLFPFLAQGHLIPAVDMAKLLAKRGVAVSILVTPENGKRVKPVVDRAIASGLSIRVFHLKLPGAEAGLPQGCENMDMLPSMEYGLSLFNATAMLREQVEGLLVQLQPTCLVADMCFPWATDMALKLRIPRLVFHGTSCFSLVCMNILQKSKILEGVVCDRDYFVVSDQLPDRIEITKAQLMGTAAEIPPEWAQVRRQMFESEDEAVGTVANTFQELEPQYVGKYIKETGKKVWCIGPVSLCNMDDSDKAERGNKAAIDGQDCLKWLDSHEPDSVIYVCLGSISRLADTQLIELGLGLEASNRPFIWVIRHARGEFESWLSEEKFEERIGGRGLLIRGWAPQVLILSHPSVGGFITHCGWNSTLEAVSAGMPMLTWPVFAEQFCNEKFIVNVIKTGIRVGVEVPVLLGIGDEVGGAVQVMSDEVKMGIHKLMDGGEEGEERRERARKLAETAKSAVEEGGSSHLNITQLIQDMVLLNANYGEQSANGAKLDEEVCSEIVVQ
ncbi:don-glucosyltransferase 1 [Perilla frutescens var. frutescens]|nr:don-glucosyltransferase 1 [Perilla frutescens var. frutescens]